MSDPIRVQAETDEATQENERASAEPLVVRTLKPPPEIWDLVQETPEHFNPRGAFVARLTSSKTNLILLTLLVVLISGLGVFGVMTLRDERNVGDAAVQVHEEERTTTQTVPSSQASAPASAPVSAPMDAPVNTSPDEYRVDNTPPAPTDSRATDPQPADLQPTSQPGKSASAGNALTDNAQPTGVSVSNISMEAVGAVAALSGNKRARVGSGRPNADKPRPARAESETATDVAASVKPQTSDATPQTAVLKKSDEKSSIESSAQTESNKTPSRQLTAPPPPPPAISSAPKAKVIQWP